MPPIDPPDPARMPGREDKAEIVERLYDVALNPIRLEELLDVWEGRAGTLRENGTDVLSDPDIAPHLDRAGVFLDRYEPGQPDATRRSILEAIPRSAAFLSDGGATIRACNRAARQAFGLHDDGPLDALPFHPEDIALLRREIARVLDGKAERVVTLRLHSTVTGSVVIMRVAQIDNPDPLALVISTELVWPEGFEDTVQEAFGLTASEVDIVRSITMGLQVRAIAEARGRSTETVRTQLRSILAKTETHSQPELVRVVLGLMDVALVPMGQEEHRPGQTGLTQIEPEDLRRPDGRVLRWIEFGDPAGAPVLYMHLDYGLVRWPAAAEAAARAAGLRVVVPFRAWFGGTSPLRSGTAHLAGVTADYAAVMDHLGLARAVVVSQGADLRFALNLSLQRPDLVRGILGCAPQLPLQTPTQYDRMDKWQRFILANARYTPKILPFIVKAGFSLVRKLGPEGFFRKVNSGSPADMAAFADPAIREAVIAGASLTLLHPRVEGHVAFTQEALGSEWDWSHLLTEVRVPVQLLQADQDPQSPVQTVTEVLADFPKPVMEIVANTGQLLLFARWQLVLDRIAHLHGRNARSD